MNILKLLYPLCANLCILSLAWPPENLKAQSTAPLRSQTFCYAPYLHKLSDWRQSVENKMDLRLYLLDEAVPQAQVKLRMVLESDKIRIENPTPLPRSYTVFGGEPLTLSFVDLRNYMETSVLSFSGFSKQEYLRNGERLPDGVYRLYFEVFELASGVKVSFYESPAIFTLISCDPPLLNSPLQNTTIFYQDYLHLDFRWTPRHLASGAFQSEYLFELVEIPEGYSGDWQRSFDMLPPVYRQNTQENAILYDESMPRLRPGNRYAFRVKASCQYQDGTHMSFNNQGYSEVFSFLYKEDCKPIDFWKVDSIGPYKARMIWSSAPEDQSYTVFYRRVCTPQGEWFTNTLGQKQQSYSLYPLEPSTTYECKISRQCLYCESENNKIQNFTTPSKDNSFLRCGEHDQGQESENLPKEPLPILRKFDLIKTQSGFVFAIDDVVGENGYFSGKAHTFIPLLANTGVKVTFSRLFVNIHYEVVSGSLQAEVSRRKL